MTRDELEFSISQYLDGTLAESEQSALEDRFARDPAARALLAEHRELTTLLKTAPLPPVRWDKLAESISAAVADLEPDSNASAPAAPFTAAAGWLRRGSRMPRLWLPVGLAAAASIVITASIGVRAYLSHRGPGATMPTGPVASHISVDGPKADYSAGPSVAEVTVGPGAGKDQPSTSPFAEDVVSRPSRFAIGAGEQPAQDSEQAPQDADAQLLQ